MNSRIMSDASETVTVVRLSADKDEEKIVAADIVCLISSVENKYDHWQAVLAEANPDILTGDILRREDGSELQVLRSDTAKGRRIGVVMQLDLKDYNRQEPPLQENEVDASRSDFLSQHEIHPAISSKVWSFFSHRAYDTAVFEAFKQVEIAVRKAGGYAETDIGTKLMSKAFNVKNGDLVDENQGKAEREARFFLFVGAIGAYKNPGSHRDVEITAEEAIEMIALASLLLRIVDSRSQSEEN